MAKNTGSNLRLKFGTRCYPINSATFAEKIDEIDVTTSSTLSDGTDFLPNRMEGELKFETFARETEGTEIATGTLTATQHYLVTLGTITQGSDTYTVGEIFQSNGTETTSASNKVKPLGAILLGKGISLSIGGSTIAVTNVDFNVEYSDIDVTDTNSSASTKEWITSRAKRTSKVEGWINDAAADLVTASVPSSNTAVVLTLKSGYTVSGNAYGMTKDVVGAVNDATKLNYSYTWNGSPTVTAGLFLTAGVSTAFEFSTSPKGASTRKQYAGNAIITNIAVSSGVNEPVKISYTAKVSGAWTEVLKG